MSKWTPGPWLVATSNSWRRIVSRDGDSVCEPIKQNDGHPDLYFRNGGFDGPDAKLIARAPDMAELLRTLVDADKDGALDDAMFERARALLAEIEQ